MDKKIVQVYNVGGNELPSYSTEFSAGFDIRADLSDVKVYDKIMGNGRFVLTLSSNKLLSTSDELVLN